MKQKFKTIFISDIHLGSIACKSEYILQFLKETEADTYYLVGDVIDGWRIKSKFFWPQQHSDVIRKFLKIARTKKIIYILGNHDEFLRPYLEYNLNFGNIEIVDEKIFTTVTGKKYWVVHGDIFDGVIRYAKWLSILGDHAYVFIIWLNHYLNKIRKFFGLPYWSLSKYLKNSTKKALQFMDNYARVVSLATKEKGYDGVICGHIHNPIDTYYNETHYLNTGDWVENCSFLVEDMQGNLIIKKFVEVGHEKT